MDDFHYNEEYNMKMIDAWRGTKDSIRDAGAQYRLCSWGEEIRTLQDAGAQYQLCCWGEEIRTLRDAGAQNRLCWGEEIKSHYLTDEYVDQGPDTRNYLRIPYLMEIEFTTTGAPKCGVRT